MNGLRRCISAALVLIAAGGVLCISAQDVVKRPKITGVADVGYFTSDLPKAIAFWHDFLGYDEAYGLHSKEGVRVTFIKLNDHQHVELFNEPPTVPQNMLHHLSFTVDDVDQMRAYLRAKGVAVEAGAGKTLLGDRTCEVKDPDGTLVRFVQSSPTGTEAADAGKHLPETRISSRIYHLGFLVGDSRKTMDFYALLGFMETWRGSGDPKELSWINLKVPDGLDYVELMLYHAPSEPRSWGSKNHISLAVPDIAKSVQILEARPAFKDYGKPLAIRTGVNGKRQVNLFDPDGTRVELMEPFTVDGKPRPSSTAPPPLPAPQP